jgi:hypothetical protein
LLLALNLEQENSIFCSTKLIYQKRLKNYKNEDFSYKIQKILKKIKNIYYKDTLFKVKIIEVKKKENL